ncbi:MBL fold metallo-hydrolase [Paenibacillus sp. J22TS3]|uniref:MBL fold metallo-hydrolase n=1 Tax=Paenibacillus sp. J22TS3 TaxID=2807192 RepID=UPI001B2B0529|nr:MBL fold metallo-hydrolase [Paenibacillus sp. J22TS3]GIP24467.1 MBL fold metallo-hydrolase [Paenibacillus sp. J22TS3]
MRIRQDQYLTQLTFLPRLFPVNCYLVEEDNGLTLIDAALPYSAAGILKAAQRMGKPITRIVLTHAHDDHVGALDKLKMALPEAEISISARDARLMAGDRSLDPGEDTAKIRGGVPASLKARPDRLLQEGDLVGSLRVIAAPGHTPGSIALLDTRSGALIVGDAFQVRGGMAVSGQLRPLFPFPAWGTWSPATALRSAQKLRDLEPALLAAGHGAMRRSPVQAMDRAIEAAARNLAGGAGEGAGRHA